MDSEIIKALALSIAFTGVMLSIVSAGIIFYLFKFLRKSIKELIWMGILIFSWAIFIFFNTEIPTDLTYHPIFLVYSLFHIIAIILGATIFTTFLIISPKLWKVFNKNLLIIAGIFAFLSIASRIIFPFFDNIYLALIQRIIIILPPLFGFFMIIKYAVDRKNAS